MKPFLLPLLCAPLSVVLLAALPAHAADPTLDVTVNGSTVTLTQDVPSTIGAGTVVPVGIGNVVAGPDGSVSEAGTLAVDGVPVLLTARTLSFTPTPSLGGGTIQYTVDGGGPLDLGPLGQIVVQPFGGTVSPTYAPVRVPVIATLTWHAAATPASAPEPSAWAAFGLGTLGLAALAARRRIRF